MELLMMGLCISIGTGVPWLVAIYAENGDRQLIENTMLALAATALGAVAFNWIFGRYGLIALVALGPAVAYLAIVVGQAARRAVAGRLRKRRVQ